MDIFVLQELTPRERNNQYKIIHHILKLKGFSVNQISKIKNPKKLRKGQETSKKKKFLTTIKFNGCSNRHKYVNLSQL